MSETKADSSCGTYAGVQRHKKQGEALCADCMEAQRNYMRDYRNRKGLAKDAWWNRTHDIARRRLAAKYPRQFARILAEVRREHPVPCESGEQDPPQVA